MNFFTYMLQGQTASMNGSLINYDIGINIEELNSLFSATEANSQSVSRNTNFTPITSEQLSAALASVMGQLQQSDTSGTSTSTAISENMLEHATPEQGQLSEEQQQIQEVHSHPLLNEANQPIDNLGDEVLSILNEIDDADINDEPVNDDITNENTTNDD